MNLFVFVFPVHSDNLEYICGKYAADPAYRKILDFYAYRLQEYIDKYGCDLIPVYYAFGNEKSDDLLALAETNPELMNALINLFEGNEKIAQLLASNQHLAAALLHSLLNNEGAIFDLIARIKSLNNSQIKILSRGKPAAAALAFLVPNLSPEVMDKNFTSSELDTLLALVSICAISFDSVNEAGLEELLPFFSTNPNDAAMVYKGVIRAWGQAKLADLIRKDAAVMMVLVPPLTADSMKDCGILNWTPEQFHKMQIDYITIMRDMHKLAERNYGLKWAGEICRAFADSLAAGLLVANTQERQAIRSFLLSLIGDQPFVRKLFIESGCFEKNNFQLLGELLNKLGNAANSNTQVLLALADWHDKGRLGALLQDWLKNTDAKRFSQGAICLTDEQGEINLDAITMNALINLAMFRQSLAPEQKKVIDYLLDNLPRKGTSPAYPLAFINEIKEPLFKVLKPGRFQNQEGVASHLLADGYPESHDDSLYESFIKNQSQGYMPAVADALARRGSLPEFQLLEHGRTFADRHYGYSALDLLEMADDTITIGLALAGTIGTAGLAAPAVVLATGRVAAKQAARRAAKSLIRSIAKSKFGLSQITRKVAINGARGVRKAFEKSVSGVATKRSSGQLVRKISLGKRDILNDLDAAVRVYTLLGGSGLVMEIGEDEYEPLCPDKTRE